MVYQIKLTYPDETTKNNLEMLHQILGLKKRDIVDIGIIKILESEGISLTKIQKFQKQKFKHEIYKQLIAQEYLRTNLETSLIKMYYKTGNFETFKKVFLQAKDEHQYKEWNHIRDKELLEIADIINECKDNQHFHFYYLNDVTFDKLKSKKSVEFVPPKMYKLDNGNS